MKMPPAQRETISESSCRFSRQASMEFLVPISSSSLASSSSRPEVAATSPQDSRGARRALDNYSRRSAGGSRFYLSLGLAALACCLANGRSLIQATDRKSAPDNSSVENQNNLHNAYPADVEGYKIKFSDGENYVIGEATSPNPEEIDLTLELQLEINQSIANEPDDDLVQLELMLEPEPEVELDAMEEEDEDDEEGFEKRRRRKRALRSARPKITRRILKKVTPTKVIIGAHLGTMAYRKFANWTGGPAASANNSSQLNNSTVLLANGTLLGVGGGVGSSNKTVGVILVPVSNQTLTIASNSTKIPPKMGKEPLQELNSTEVLSEEQGEEETTTEAER